MEVTREMWARSFLKWMDAPVTKRNMVALVAWQAAEGSPARWNPLATTMDWPGATVFNTHGVKHYQSQEDGLNATLKTLSTGSQHGYDPIVKRLRRSARPRRTLAAVERSSWGTGGLAKSIVDDVKANWNQYARQPIGQ